MVDGSNSSQYPSPCGPVSLIAVESAFHARKNPASMEMKDWPDCVFSSVTRRICVPNVGSAIAVLAGPKAGGGGSGFGSVPVYAEYVDGELADCGLAAAEIVHTKDKNSNTPMPTESSYVLRRFSRQVKGHFNYSGERSVLSHPWSIHFPLSPHVGVLQCGHRPDHRGVVSSQRSIRGDTPRPVGVGQRAAAKRDEIGASRRQQRLRTGGIVEPAIGDDSNARDALGYVGHISVARAGCGAFKPEMWRKEAPAATDRTEDLTRRCLAARPFVAWIVRLARVQTNADRKAAGTARRTASTVSQANRIRFAISIDRSMVGPQVDAVSEELIDEITVGAVQLDAVETGLDRAHRRAAEFSWMLAISPLVNSRGIGSGFELRGATAEGATSSNRSAAPRRRRRRAAAA